MKLKSNRQFEITSKTLLKKKKYKTKKETTKQRLNFSAWHPIDVTEVRFINKTTGEQQCVYIYHKNNSAFCKESKQ